MKHLISGSLLSTFILTITVNSSFAALPGVKQLKLPSDAKDLYYNFISREAPKTESSKYLTEKIIDSDGSALFVSRKWPTIIGTDSKRPERISHMYNENFGGAKVELLELVPNKNSKTLIVRESEWQLPSENIGVSKKTSFQIEKGYDVPTIEMNRQIQNVQGKEGFESTLFRVQETFNGPTTITSRKSYRQDGEEIYFLYAPAMNHRKVLNMDIDPKHLGLDQKFNKTLTFDISTIAKHENAFIQDFHLIGNQITIKYVDEIDGKKQLREIKLDIINEQGNPANGLSLYAHPSTNLGSKALDKTKAKVTTYGERTKVVPGSNTTTKIDMTSGESGGAESF